MDYRQTLSLELMDWMLNLPSVGVKSPLCYCIVWIVRPLESKPP